MKTRIPLILATALLALAACYRSLPPPEPENYSDPVEEEVVNTPEPAPMAPLVEEPLNIPEPVVELPPPPEPVRPDEQVLEDAEATGMTARVNRDGGDADNQPAEDTEQR